jgi:ring-1,2-phenylacetyl-CoA epoxidase subunit PaaD
VSPAEQIPLLEQEVFERSERRTHSPYPRIWVCLDRVSDPEIPVLSLWDLGVLQDVTMEGETVVVVISPTYSGCPAVAVMAEDIESCLTESGYDQVRVERTLAPVWGTHFMSEEAHDKLREFQIAAPGELNCPNCGAAEVELVSEFSSTACKALYRCTECREAFDYFKPH